MSTQTQDDARKEEMARQQAVWGLRSVPPLTWLLVFSMLLGCATTYRPSPAAAPFAFTLTPEQCLELKAERRSFRATEQAAGYVTGASALVTLLFLPLLGEKTGPALSSGVGLLAGGTAAWTGAQVDDLDKELEEGGCR